jgi:hypothetical protein
MAGIATAIMVEFKGTKPMLHASDNSSKPEKAGLAGAGAVIATRFG